MERKTRPSWIAVINYCAINTNTTLSICGRSVFGTVPRYRAPYLQKAEGFFESSIELYILFSLSQKMEKCWIALQRARADPRDPYNPPLMWGSWTPWKGCPVFILRRWEDISKF